MPLAKKKTLQQRFGEWFATLGLRHFVASEVLATIGNRRGSAVNSMPSPELWGNIEPTLRVVEELRERLGAPIRINSAYRDPDYNKAIGGVRSSQHLKFKALDITSPSATPEEIYNELVKMRTEKVFKGGLGKYVKFVHVDTRGTNANWAGVGVDY